MPFFQAKVLLLRPINKHTMKLTSFRHVLMPILAVLFLVGFTADDAQAQSKKKIFKKARKYSDDADFYGARAEYMKILEKDSLNKDANFELGIILNEYMENPVEAEKYLKRSERIYGADSVPELVYEMAKYHHMVGQFEEAKKYYSQFMSYIDESKEGKRIKKHVMKEMSDNYFAYENKTKVDKRYVVSNIGQDVNSSFPEYVPILTADNNSLIFTSRRGVPNKQSNKIDYFDMSYFEDVFLAKNDNGKFSKPILFLDEKDSYSDIKHTPKHEAAISLTHDGKRLFIYKKRKVHESEFNGTMWSEPKLMDKNINHDYYQNHASLSADGNTIFFTSEPKKSKNGLDIYMSKKSADGKWSAAENLGEMINTPYDEDSPFISPDGKTLYFSSTGWKGYGGFDVYKSTLVDGKWSAPVNMGQPINSPCDDVYFTVDAKGKSGFLSSGRVGGFGDLDIYAFKFDDCQYLQGNDAPAIVVTDPTYEKKPVKLTSTYGKVDPSLITGYIWSVNDSVVSEGSASLAYVFEEKGQYNLKLQMLAGDVSYCVNDTLICIEKPKVDSVLATNNTATNSTNNTNNTENVNQLNLANLNNVYFDLNKSGLRDDAIAVLNKNIEVLKSNKEITIRVEAHADSRGSKQYNVNLSANRSRAVVNYLVKNGVKRSRIKTINNFGESKLANQCSDEVECDETQHQQNRRVELFIVK